MNNHRFSSNDTHPHTGPLELALASLVALVLCLYPTIANAQTETLGLLKVELEDSRGQIVEDELTIGRSLYVGLQDFEVGTTYRFALLTADGLVVDERTTTPTGPEWETKTRLFFKSNIWAEGCQPEGNPTPHPGGSGDILGPFGSLSEASSELDGMTLWLTVEQWVNDDATGGGYWFHAESKPILMIDTQEAVYYWSDESGKEKCLFESRETVYLSVYKGFLESFDSSRVFMLDRPSDKDDWGHGFDFEEARYRPGCFTTKDDDCSYENGSFETLPSTETIPMRGHLPTSGVFLALIRGSNSYAKGSVQVACDRATEGPLYISTVPHLTDTQEGWGCPPCPE